MHAEILAISTEIHIWGRNPERAAECWRDLQAALPHVRITLADSPADVARAARLIVTATASRLPCCALRDIEPGTHISAVGSDSAGKQELDPAILRHAALLLADSHRQCEKLGELQHAPGSGGPRASRSATYCDAPVAVRFRGDHGGRFHRPRRGRPVHRRILLPWGHL